jgi:hypothetical protein
MTTEIKTPLIHGIKANRDRLDLTFINEIKQNLFLFDSIGLTGVEAMLVFLYNEDRKAFNELISLQSEKLIWDTISQTQMRVKMNPDGTFSAERTGTYPIATKNLKGEDMEAYSKLSQIAHDPNNQNDRSYEAGARLCCILRNHTYGMEYGSNQYFPLVSASNFPDFSGDKETVHRIILENVPIPHPETPIDYIKEFKSDHQNAELLLALKIWVNKLTRENYTEHEIKEELKDLMNQYEKHLYAKKIKYFLTALEIATIFAFPQLALADLGARLIKAGLKYQSNKLSITSSEINFSGREIAYLYHAGSQFGKR